MDIPVGILRTQYLVLKETGRQLPQAQKLRDYYCGKCRKTLFSQGLHGVTEYGGKT